MIEKIRCRLISCFNGRKWLLRCIAILSAFTIGAISLIGYSTKVFLISDGIKEYKVFSQSYNTDKVLSSLTLKSARYNITNIIKANNLIRVSLEYKFPVYITCSDTTIETYVTKCTVEDAVKAAGFSIDKYDLIEPSADTVIRETAYIDYVNVDYVDGNYTEAIPYNTETFYSNEHDINTKTLQNGAEGVRVVNYTEKRVNGVSVESQIISTSILTQPINAKNIIGTKITSLQKSPSGPVAANTANNYISTLVPKFPIELDANGNPVNFKSRMVARATAYTYTGNNTATGVPPQPGYIAVNPEVIPYGTKMYIKSSDGRYIYGYAVAADTGGFIKKHPTGVDLFFTTESACSTFGVRNVEIFILE